MLVGKETGNNDSWHKLGRRKKILNHTIDSDIFGVCFPRSVWIHGEHVHSNCQYQLERRNVLLRDKYEEEANKIVPSVCHIILLASSTQLTVSRVTRDEIPVVSDVIHKTSNSESTFSLRKT